MDSDFTKTIEIISQPSFTDEWWVSVNGETIPEPQNLEQAKAQKPPRSRAVVLALHTGLSDEWIPIRDLEKLAKRHAFDFEKAERLTDSLNQFKENLPSELEALKNGGGLLRDPSPEQISKILDEAEIDLRARRYSMDENIIKNACPECFDPIALENPTEYEDATLLLGDFQEIEDFLYDSDGRLETISDVLSAPSIAQLVAVLKTFKNGYETSESEGANNRKLVKRIAKLFPELVKDTPEARKFFNPQPKSNSNQPLSKSNNAGTSEKTVIEINLLYVLIAIVGLFILWNVFF